MLITNEYSYKTNRQNIIDGWSRKDFMVGKLLDVIILSGIVTLLYAVVCIAIGLSNSSDSTAGKWDQAYYIGLFALQSFSQLSLAFLVGFLIRKSFMALAVFSFYFLIAEPIAVKVLKFKYHNEIGEFFPREISDRLLPPPQFFSKFDAEGYKAALAAVQSHVYYTILLLVITWLAFSHVRRLMRPLDDIRAGAIRFGRGEFDEPIPVRRDDELGELARQVNTMATEIRAMLDAKRGLLLSISHELRSPLTRARVTAELVDDSPERTALLRDLAEMRDLVSDLLESERLASGHAALQREPTDLNALVADTLATHFAGQAVGQQLAPGLPMLALDRMRLRLLLRNAVDNALRHAADAPRPPVVTTRLGDDGSVTLAVRDHGPGVPPEQLAQLSQAFYRLDRSRQRATGGVGLGLYLCRLVAQAHGSALQIRAAEPGLEVSVRFDANPLDAGA